MLLLSNLLLLVLLLLFDETIIVSSDDDYIIFLFTIMPTDQAEVFTVASTGNCFWLLQH